MITDIPNPDVAISMGCNVGCPFIGRAFDDNWGLEDPTGKSDEEFIKIIKEIEKRILLLRDECVMAKDEEVMEISKRLLAQNKEAYEELAK